MSIKSLAHNSATCGRESRRSSKNNHGEDETEKGDLHGALLRVNGRDLLNWRVDIASRLKGGAEVDIAAEIGTV